MSPSELMGERLLGLLDHPCAGRLQATAIAMACMGVYSPPFDGVEVDVDTLIVCTDLIEASGCFPLRTMAECVAAFDTAIELHAANDQGDSQSPAKNL